MDADIIKSVGQTAGIGGLALGVILLLYRDLIRKSIFPQLTKKDAYRLLRLIAILVFLIAALGIAAWVLIEMQAPVVVGDAIDADCSLVNTGSIEGATIRVGCPDENTQ